MPGQNLQRPVVEPGTEFYYTAFLQLDSERPPYENVAHIPRSAIVSWCRYEGLNEDDTDMVVQIVRELDAVYIRNCRAKIKAAHEAATRKTSRGR